MELPNELYRQIFQNAQIGVAVSDEQGAIVTVNDCLLGMGDFAREDVIGRMASDLYAEGPMFRRELIDKVMRQGQLDNQEVTFKKKDGSTFPARMSLRQVLADGRRFMVATIEDVSE